MTYAELKKQLDTLSPEQLAMPVVWSGEMRGGIVKDVWIADEDWVGSEESEAEPLSTFLDGNPELAPDDLDIAIPKGTVHLLVD